MEIFLKRNILSDIYKGKAVIKGEQIAVEIDFFQTYYLSSKTDVPRDLSPDVHSQVSNSRNLPFAIISGIDVQIPVIISP